jgi:Skp family chaperone for outer membrane proteins
MGTVRKLAAVLACTALLSVFGATAASAEPNAKCDRVAKITQRIQAKQARVAARAAKRPRAGEVGSKHRANVEDKLQTKLAALQASCSG